MKAVVITRPGEVESLEVRDVETPPPPQADRVRVRVHTAGLNRADILQRKGRYPAPTGAPKNIPGLEFAGQVDETGPDAHNWKAGDRVFGICGGGAQAEYVVVPESHLARVPANLDWAEAGAIPEVFITAHDALFTRAGLRPGESLLVHAAGSGVGTAAIQLACAAGAKAYGTSRTADKLERAKQFGLHASVAVPTDPSSFVEAVQTWTDGRGIDVILDLVGGAYFEANIKALASSGRIIFVGTSAGSRATIDLSSVMSKRLNLYGTVLRARSVEEKATATRLFANQVVPLLADGSVKAVIDRTYKIDEIREAHTRMESNESFGKIVLVLYE